MTVNNVSMNSSTNIYATNYSNTSPSQQQTQATVGMALSAMDALLAKVGQQLGLTPAQVNTGQGVMHAAFGDTAGATQNFREAAAGFESQLSPMDRSYLDRLNDEINKNSSELANQTQQNTEETSGTKGKAKNFFEAVAQALGELLGEKAANMMDSLNKMEVAGNNKVDTSVPFDKMNDAQKEEYGNAKEAQAREFSVAQTQFSADSQIYSMMSNLVNTALKTLGEAMSTLARKS